MTQITVQDILQEYDRWVKVLQKCEDNGFLTDKGMKFLRSMEAAQQSVPKQDRQETKRN